ncbi:hypothetical protein BRYFOR_08946 [Marvinbryantia formatexigens DSM 14469]|uniref:Uncharacterized protein n=1 Tax=Marvinbryantia formatexigens DSM 14469 TaxID=478749 RepID=C6LJV9_9FIRM|nr:hypothetical protein [Marvinbryantia formatexigens]EET59037.1 hypothetical protein BRYFOR_08946 [Marvinbryantia formatexigens DSM 14469]
MGIPTDVCLAILFYEFLWGNLEFPGNPEYIFRRQKNIIAMDTAFPALGAVKGKGFVQTNLHFLKIVEQFIFIVHRVLLIVKKGAALCRTLPFFDKLSVRTI